MNEYSEKIREFIQATQTMTNQEILARTQLFLKSKKLFEENLRSNNLSAQQQLFAIARIKEINSILEL